MWSTGWLTPKIQSTEPVGTTLQGGDIRSHESHTLQRTGLAEDASNDEACDGRRQPGLFQRRKAPELGPGTQWTRKHACLASEASLGFVQFPGPAATLTPLTVSLHVLLHLA